MDEYIKLEDAKNAIMDYIGEQTVSKYPTAELCKASRMGAEGAMYAIEDVPTADVAEVIHAKWEINCDGYYPYCSHCKTEPKNGVMSKRCPECGAKMDGKEKEE